jgi:hypothetical protein
MATTPCYLDRKVILEECRLRYLALAEEKSREYRGKTAAVVAHTHKGILVDYNLRFGTGVLVDGTHTFTPVAAFQDGERLF